MAKPTMFLNDPKRLKEMPTTLNSDIMREFMSEEELKVFLNKYRIAQIERYIKKLTTDKDELEVLFQDLIKKHLKT